MEKINTRFASALARETLLPSYTVYYRAERLKIPLPHRRMLSLNMSTNKNNYL